MLTRDTSLFQGLHRILHVEAMKKETITLCLLMVSGAGAVYHKTDVGLQAGEALLLCPLTADVSVTKQSFLVKHFADPTGHFPDNVFSCDWLERDPDHPDCIDFHKGSRLECIEKDRVMIKVPTTQLRENGSYQCQLVPPNDVQPFTSCLVIYSEKNPGDETGVTESAGGQSTTPTPVLHSTAAHLTQSQYLAEQMSTDVHYLAGLVAAVVALSFAVVCLLLLFLSLLTVLYRRPRCIQRMLGVSSVRQLTAERKPMNGFIPTLNKDMAFS